MRQKQRGDDVEHAATIIGLEPRSAALSEQISRPVGKPRDAAREASSAGHAAGADWIRPIFFGQIYAAYFVRRKKQNPHKRSLRGF